METRPKPPDKDSHSSRPMNGDGPPARLGEIIRYDKLATHFDEENLYSDDRRTAMRAASIAVLLEQIRLRDKLISDFRTFLLSWDMSIPEHDPVSLKDCYVTDRWEQERTNLLQSAAETLEGTGETD